MLIKQVESSRLFHLNKGRFNEYRFCNTMLWNSIKVIVYMLIISVITVRALKINSKMEAIY